MSTRELKVPTVTQMINRLPHSRESGQKSSPIPGKLELTIILIVILSLMPEDFPDRGAVGLCASCDQRKIVVSDKGSKFYLCLRSTTDPTFPKYPRLPVVQCIGYETKKQ